MSDPKSPCGVAKVLAISAVSLFGLFLASVIVNPRWAATALMTDDAYYYLKIAHNIVGGQGSTFDGFEQTNGFHPLWMLLVCCLVVLSGGGAMAVVSAVMLLNAAIAFATTFVAYRLVRDRLAPGFEWHAVALLMLPNVWMGMTNGMETSILSFLVLLFVRQVVVHNALDPRRSAGSTVALGCLLGGILLARLDSAFLLVSLGLITVIGALVKGLPIMLLLRRAFLLGGSAAFVAGPYFWWNVSVFGSPMPISGAVKSTLPNLRSSLSLDTDLGFGLGLLLVLLASTGVLMLGEVRRGASVAKCLRSPFPVIALGALLHFMHAWLFLDWGVYWWHFTVAAITLPIIVPTLLARWVAHDKNHLRRVLHVGATGIALAGVVLQAQIARNKHARHSGWLDAAEWARANTSKSAVFALKDAGLFSYFADRQVVNLDGKASGVGYIDAMRGATVKQYLEYRGVEYLADIESSYRDGLDTIYLPRAGVPGLLVQVPRRLEVYRAAAAPPRSLGVATEGADAGFAIWRFDSDAITVK